MFWTPAFAGVTLQETFYETINFSLFTLPFSGDPVSAFSQKALIFERFHFKESKTVEL
jgi:hypothetical protein